MSMDTHFDTLRSIVPSPSRGILVTFLNLNPCCSSNFSSAEHIMLTNLLLDEGSCGSNIFRQTLALYLDASTYPARDGPRHSTYQEEAISENPKFGYGATLSPGIHPATPITTTLQSSCSCAVSSPSPRISSAFGR